MRRSRVGVGSSSSYTTTVQAQPRLSSVAEHGTDVGAAPSALDWRRTRGHTVGGGSGLNSNLRRTGASIIARRNVFRDEPWKSSSVQALTSKMGRGRDANPLLVEGPAGPVISAVGQRSDNAIASTVLAHAQEQRVKNGLPMPFGRTQVSNAARRSAGNAILHGGQLRQRHNHKSCSFGAVYEHRDAFGKPKFVGRTEKAPEVRFAQDIQQHQAVRNLMTYERGRSDVVWTGVGTYPLGPEEMSKITERIVEERSKKLHAQKLRGPKPYSRHGY